MDVREFVSDTLVQIQLGVQDAIMQLQATPGAVSAINPVWGVDTTSITEAHRQNVEFDIAVTVTDKAAGGGKAGVKVLVFEAAGEGSKSHETSTVSRIKFTVPIVPAVTLVAPAPVAQWPQKAPAVA